MLRIYRRHRKSCAHRGDGKYRRCRCPIWIDGFLGDQDIRKSLRVADWQKAETMRGDLAAAGVPEVESGEPISIEAAEREFLAVCESRKLKKSSIDRYRILFRELGRFAAQEGFRFLKQIDTPTLNRFRATWKGRNGQASSGLTDLKKLQRLRSFFRFALDHGRIQRNPTAMLRDPKIRLSPTLPFSQEEMFRILEAAAKKITTAKPVAKNKARRLRALILLLRYSGLRISDAIGCAADNLQNGKLFRYTQKTGQHVYCPLPPFVVAELESVPRVSDRYWFWTGGGTVESARKKWSKALADLFADAQVERRSRPPLPRHDGRRTPESRHADRARLDSARAFERADHREALQPVESRAPGASRGRRRAVLGDQPHRASRSGGAQNRIRSKHKS